MDEATKRFIATGIAGYAVSMELLTVLTGQGVLTDDRMLEIIDRALAGVEAVDGDLDHELSAMARDLLGGHLTDFRKQMEARSQPDADQRRPGEDRNA